MRFLHQGRKRIKVLGLLLCTMATSFCCYAQENDTDDVDDLIDELFFNDKQFIDELLESKFNYNFIYTSISANSNTYFSGRDSGTDQFSIIPQISYYHSSGFNVSVSGIFYEEFTPNWDFTSVYVGYFNTLLPNNNLIYSLGYSRFFYSDDFDDFTNSIDATLGIRTKKRNLGTTFALSYLFGTDNSVQLVSNSFANINLKRTTSLAVRLRPNVSFVVAEQTYTNSRLVRTPLGPRRVTTTQNIFDLLNTQISLPVSMTLKNWDFELGYNINLPNAVANENNLPTTNFFSFSLGYLMDFK